MKTESAQRPIGPGNPLANLFVVIAGAVMITVSLVLGFFAFVVIAVVIGLLAAVVGVRVWWLGRRLRRASGGGGPSQDGSVIEGEYRVVDRDKAGR